jgi:hypothetical protein
MDPLSRRQVLQGFASLAGTVVLVPVAVGCASSPPPAVASASAATSNTGTAPPLPTARPTGWDAIAFNRARGNAGAVPEGYREAINAPDGAAIGKHLPYVPALAAGVVPAGKLALMFGDPSRGYAKHPNSAPSANDPTGHWFNWIRVRKATNGDATEVESRFSAWPTPAAGDTGAYAPREGTDVTAEGGRNTVYLVALPPDVRPGDLVRVHGHCLTHGEYVDFVTVPS